MLFLDEIDALQNETLILVLRQLRVGYTRRPDSFPSSRDLIGLRDVRDYKVASGGSDRLTTASPFNIKADSLTLRSFTRDEVQEMIGHGQWRVRAISIFVPPSRCDGLRAQLESLIARTLDVHVQPEHQQDKKAFLFAVAAMASLVFQ